MSGYEPRTSLNSEDKNADLGAGQQSFLMIWLAFETKNFAGYLQRQEDGNGRLLYLDGHILRKSSGSLRRIGIINIEHELQFVPGTRVCSGGVLTVSLADGETILIEAKTLLAPWCYKCTGYDGGYLDEKGLGFHRGEVLEYDVYDVTHPENVVLPDGRVIRPWHREANCTLLVNGEPGRGHLPVINSGHILRYGLTGSIINKSAGS